MRACRGRVGRERLLEETHPHRSVERPLSGTQPHRAQSSPERARLHSPSPVASANNLDAGSIEYQIDQGPSTASASLSVDDFIPVSTGSHTVKIVAKDTRNSIVATQTVSFST